MAELKANAVLEFVFPELPETLYSRHSDDRVPPSMAVQLPADYRRGKAFPLFVFLEGGRGAPGDRSGLARVRRICGARGHIAVTLPLFKKELDSEEIHGGLLIGACDDLPLISRCYRKMLGKLKSALPDIDWQRSALGGFSNGAHSTAMLLCAVDRFILSHFGSFYLIEGGLYLSSLHKRRLREKNILFMYGGAPSDSAGSRRRRLRMIKAICAAVFARNPMVTVLEMKGVGHRFAPRHMPMVRKWLAEVSSR